MGTLIKEIPDEFQPKCGWTVEVNGQVVEKVSRVRISNPKFGELNYGLEPGERYDTWSFREIGGGGVVIVPFAILFKHREVPPRASATKTGIYVGMIIQDRPNQGGEVLNLPRGFIDPGQSHLESAFRELEEEIGYDAARTSRLFELEGDAVNPNSGFFETIELGEGVKFYALRVMQEELEEEEDSDVYNFREGTVKPISKDAEKIIGCRFYHWWEAVDEGDMFTVAAVGRLIKYLTKNTNFRLAVFDPTIL